MDKKWNQYLFIITLIFFSLGFVNIIFALFGFVCLILPFILLFKDRKKTWCQQYCPRSRLFTVVTNNRYFSGKPGPDWLIKGKGKWFVLAYFTINILMMTMSTIRVANGLMAPVEKVRFLIVFIFPWKLPQIFNNGYVADWLIHLSYRIYSMMFTTTIIGLLLALLFLPRTWCRVCPINTLSDISLKKKNLQSVGGLNENL